MTSRPKVDEDDGFLDLSSSSFFDCEGGLVERAAEDAPSLQEDKMEVISLNPTTGISFNPQVEMITSTGASKFIPLNVNGFFNSRQYEESDHDNSSVASLALSDIDDDAPRKGEEKRGNGMLGGALLMAGFELGRRVGLGRNINVEDNEEDVQNAAAAVVRSESSPGGGDQMTAREPHDKNTAMSNGGTTTTGGGTTANAAASASR